VLLARKQEVEAWLASEDAYSDGHREQMKTTLAEQGEFTWQLARLEAEWLEIADALQAMENS
jgi:ATP-binding cassette, subfamily F, member 3